MYVFKDHWYAKALVLSTNITAPSTATAEKLLASQWGDISSPSVLPRMLMSEGGEPQELF